MASGIKNVLSAQTANKRRFALAMTGMVVCITIGGTLYGATLKQDQQIKEIKHQREEEPIADRLARLQSSRSLMIAKRDELRTKIQDLKDRSAQKTARQSEFSAASNVPKG